MIYYFVEDKISFFFFRIIVLFPSMKFHVKLCYSAEISPNRTKGNTKSVLAMYVPFKFERLVRLDDESWFMNNLVFVYQSRRTKYRNCHVYVINEL